MVKLDSSRKSQSDLETMLVLSKSNLTLAIANNEMLEEALKREGGTSGKDIGWRRWSEREGLLKKNHLAGSDPSFGAIPEPGTLS